jgi:hypothetical protein
VPGWPTRLLARFCALLAHGVGHVARHLRYARGLRRGYRRERMKRAGKRQRGERTPHVNLDCFRKELARVRSRGDTAAHHSCALSIPVPV